MTSDLTAHIPIGMSHAVARRAPHEFPLGRIVSVLLWAFVFCIPWENQIMLSGFGTVGRLIGVVVFGVSVWALADAAVIRSASSIHVLLTLFVAWCGLTYFWTMSTSLTIERTSTLAQLLAMTWLMWQFAPDRRHVTGLLKAYVAGSAVAALYTIADYSMGRMANYERYSGAGFNPNDLALILALSLPMAIYLACWQRRSLMLALYYGHVVIAFGAILLTASRTALLASSFAAVLLATGFIRLSVLQKTLCAVIIAIAFFWGLQAVPETSVERLGTTFNEVEHGTLNERSVIWDAGFSVFQRRDIVGVGAGAFPVAVAPSLGVAKAAHNSFISVLVENGIIGFCLFAAVLITAVIYIARLRGLERHFYAALLLTWMTGVLSLTWEFRKPTWLIFALIAAQSQGMMPGSRPSEFGLEQQ